MVIKKYIYYNRTSNLYVIVYRKYYVMSDSSIRNVLRAYDECVKCGWKKNQLEKIRKKYKKRKKDDEGIYKQHDGYILYLRLNGERTYCGRYKNITQARQMKRKILRGEVEPPVKRRKKKRRQSNKKDRYIKTARNGMYQIIYNQEGWGTFRTIEEAREERDALIRAGWDYSELEGQE